MRVAEIPIFLRPRAIVTPGGSGIQIVNVSALKSWDNVASSPEALTAGWNFTAGNAVFIAFTYYNSNDNSAAGDIQSITASGTAMVKDAGIQSSAAPAYRTQLWRASGVAGGNGNISITEGNIFAGTYMAGYILEVSGLHSSPVDQVPTPVTDGDGSLTITAGGNNAGADALVLGVVGHATGYSAGDNGLAFSGGGYTQKGPPGLNFLGIMFGYKIVSALETSSFTSTTTTSPDEQIALLATYKKAP